MLKHQRTTNLILQLAFALVIAATFLPDSATTAVPDKMLCADENCKNIISMGTGVVNYHAGDKHTVSFRANSKIRIKSKSPNGSKGLWGIEVNGREGFAPANMIREDKVLVPTKNLILVNMPKLETSSNTLETSSNTLQTSSNTLETSSAKPTSDNTISGEVNVVNSDITPTATLNNGEGFKVDGTLIPNFDNVEKDIDKVENENLDQLQLASDINNELETEKHLPKENLISENIYPTPSSVESSSSFGNTMNSVEFDDGEIGDYDDDDGDYEEELHENIDSTPVPPKAEIVTQVLPSSNSSDMDNQQEEKNKIESSGVLPGAENITSSSNLTQTDNNEELKNNLDKKEQILKEEDNSKANKTDDHNQNVNTTSSLDMNSNTVKATFDASVVSENSDVGATIADTNLKPLHSDDKTTEVIENNSLNATETELGVDKAKDETVENVESVSSLPVQYSNETNSNNDVTNQVLTGESVDNTNLQADNEKVEVTTVGPTVSEETSTAPPATVLENDAKSVTNQNKDNGINNDINYTENMTKEISDEIENASKDLKDSDNSYSAIPEDLKDSDNSNSTTPINPNINVNSNVDNQIPFQANTEAFNEIHTEDSKKKPEESNSSILTDVPKETIVQHQSQESQDAIENSHDYNNNKHYNPYDYAEVTNTPLPPQTTTDTNEKYIHESYTNEPTNVERETDVTTPIPVTNNYDYTHHSPYDHTPTTESEEALNSQIYSDYPTEDPMRVMPTEPVPVLDTMKKDNKGLFATIMDTVNNILPNSKKQHNDIGHETDNQLNRILYPDMEIKHSLSKDEKLFCEKLDSNNCPHASILETHISDSSKCSIKDFISSDFTLETFLQAFASKVLEISELIAFLAIVAAASLFFIFGYYCFCNSSSEGALLSKLNQLESSLLASHKENAILKHNLMATRQKLASIEDNSFGSNDMVVSLRKELEEELLEKAGLQEQIVSLQKELENAADAGIELNKIVSELLSNQTGDESIISSVEELQKQLNEQQNTILEINASLAEKSRENSELQLIIAEQNNRYESKLSDLQQDNDELESEKSNLQTRLEEIRTDFDREITAALEGKNFEIKRLQNEIIDLNNKIESEHTKWQTSMAKIEALEECLKNLKKDPNVNITQVINVANVKAELLDAQKKLKVLKDRWELEQDARKLAEGQLQSATTELEKIKQDFNQTEKDKLEAQTRLEVLSNYFKEKENQLQKELSLKETMWLKQQGETTTTVDRLTAMQEEIQSLKSQNDALRAEIEAQDAAHKAQTGTLENRAHETWLAARQSDRRYEEARAEATALRRKLTVLAGSAANEVNKQVAGPPTGIGDDLANAPSPIHMESPGSPMLNRMPPPPFLPPPFMGPPPPFMGLPPPPPFVPPGEMRPAPLGRIMSPPPSQRSGHVDYDEYLDYEGNSSWHRHHTYSPPPRTYRSLSPTDSRYNYGTERDLISTYDTETDFSPPPSPRETRRRGPGGGYGSENEDSRHRHQYNNSKKGPAVNKVPESSGSDKSYNSSSKKGNRSKSSGGKFLV